MGRPTRDKEGWPCRNWQQAQSAGAVGDAQAWSWPQGRLDFAAHDVAKGLLGRAYDRRSPGSARRRPSHVDADTLGHQRRAKQNDYDSNQFKVNDGANRIKRGRLERWQPASLDGAAPA